MAARTAGTHMQHARVSRNNPARSRVCCGFLATRTNHFGRLTPPGVDESQSEVEHIRALAGGFTWAPIALSNYLGDAGWDQRRTRAAITAVKKLPSTLINIGTCTFVLRRA
jgi:hypothetical protein